MVLGWDFKFKDAHGKERETVTSINLLAEVTYPVMMNQIIDDKTKRDDQLVKNLFFETRDVPKVVTRVEPSIADPKQVLPDLPKNAPTTNQEPLDTTEHFGELLQPKPNGFGFIKCKEFPDNVFYSWSALRNMDFKELQQGQKVKFGKVERNDDGLFTTVVDVLLPQKDSCESTK